MPYYVYYPMAQDTDGPKLKELDVFRGKDPAKLTPFISQCIQWFYAKPRKFPGNREKVLFVASYLRDLAGLWWMPHIAEDPPPLILDDWYTFTAELFCMFGNQHLATTAITSLKKLHMKENTRVSEYLVKFNSFVPYTGWNEIAIAGKFYENLPKRIKDAFQYMNCPREFAGLRDGVLNIDQRYWECQEEQGIYPVKADYSDDKPNNKDNKGNKSQGSQSRQQNSAPSSSKSSSAPRPQNNSSNCSTTSAPAGSSSSSTTSESPKKGPLTRSNTLDLLCPLKELRWTRQRLR